MRFWEAIREIQENGKKCFAVGRSEYYFWGDVLDVPCLKNSLGEEVRPNSWLMRAEWRFCEEPKQKKKVTLYRQTFKGACGHYQTPWQESMMLGSVHTETKTIEVE